MGYLGQTVPYYDPTNAPIPQVDVERFSGDDSTVAFTLTRRVSYATDIEVFVDNIQQEPTTAYSVDGFTLTFTEAPPTASNNIYVIYRNSYGIQNFATVGDGSITYNKLANNIRQMNADVFTANGSGTTVELSDTPYNANTLIVTLDGVLQTPPTNYTLSGSTITFTSTPAANTVIAVRHMGFRTGTVAHSLMAGDVGTVELENGAVTTAKLADNAVTNDKVALTYTSDAFVANGSGQTFTVTDGHNANSVFVHYNGICMIPIVDYDVSGTTLTMTFTPTANSNVAVRYLPV